MFGLFEKRAYITESEISKMEEYIERREREISTLRLMVKEAVPVIKQASMDDYSVMRWMDNWLKQAEQITKEIQ